MFQIQGILKQITPIETGVGSSGNSWQKCTAIVEAADGQYNTTYAFSVFNKDIALPVGSVVVVDFFVKSKEWNGKWFTNLMLHSITSGVQQPVYAPPAQPQYNQQGYQQPMAQQPYRQPVPQQHAAGAQQMPQQPQAQPQVPNPSENFGDLPF